MNATGKIALLCLLMALTVAVASCTLPAPNRGSAGDLEGSWRLTAVTEGGVTWRPDPRRTPFTLIIDEEGAHGEIACNHWAAPVEVKDGRIAIGPSRRTRLLCLIDDPRHAGLERRYLDSLSRAAPYRLTDGQLSIQTGEREQWLFTRAD